MNNEENTNVSTKNRMTALMLCWFLGLFGVHRLYAGKLTTGFFMAYGTIFSCCVLAMNFWLGLTALVLMSAWVVNDFLVISFKKFRDCYGNDIVSDRI